MATLISEFEARVKCVESQVHTILNPGSTDTPDMTEMCSNLNKFILDLTNILQDATLHLSATKDCEQKGTSAIKHCFIALDKKYNFPKFAYFGLYELVLNLLNNLSKVSYTHEELTKLILECLCLAMVFVEENTRIDLPSNVAGMIYQVKDKSSFLQEKLMNALCRTIIPVCFGVVVDENLQDLDDIPSIIILVLESVNDISYHFELIETLMMFKQDLWIDIMSVITCSDGIARVFATQLLFHYWPHLHSTRSSQHKMSSCCAYKPMLCEHPNCQSSSLMNTASTMLLDAAYPTKVANKPPPLYLCNTCTQKTVEMKQCWDYMDVILPTQHITYYCQNKHCLAKDSVATVTLLGSKSTGTCKAAFFSQLQKHNSFWHYDNHIVRYCNECYNNLQHAIGCLNLAVQLAPNVAWYQKMQNTRVIVDAVICLLSEEVTELSFNHFASTYSNKKYDACESMCPSMKDNNDGYNYGMYPCDGCIENVGIQSHDSMTLSHFGVWLLVSLCPPEIGINEELVSQLIAAVLVWYKNTYRLAADECGSRLENLKSLFLLQWIKEMYKFYFKNFLNCLLPNPPPESRVQGYWDTIQPLWYHYKNGLNFLTCLATYSIISFDMWECLMPCWMTALCGNLDASELKKLEKAINVLFDENLSPLGFEPRGIFNFLMRNFKGISLVEHECALEWMQMLTEVNVYIPISRLFDMVSVSSSRLQFALHPASKGNDESDTENEEGRMSSQLPFLSGKESLKVMNRSHQPGVDSLDSILESMNTRCSGPCDASDCDVATPVMNECRKGLNRSGSTRASKRIKNVLMKSTRSFTRRTSPRQPDEFLDADKFTAPRTARSSTTTLLSPVHATESVGDAKIPSKLNCARIIACYVDILDVVHQQLLLQAYQKHTGLYSVQSIPVGKLLCDLLWQILENRERSSTDENDDRKQIELSFTEEFFDLTGKLLAFVLPQASPERVNGNRSKSKWNIDSDRSSPISTSIQFEESDIHKLKQPFQLLYLFVKTLGQYENDRAIVERAIACISLLCIEGEIFEVAAETKKPIIRELELKMLIPSLWRQLDVSCSDASKTIVAVLFKVLLSVENAWLQLIELFNSAFTNKPSTEGDSSIDAWSCEFETIDRIHALLTYTSEHKEQCARDRSPVSHVVAYALCLLLAALDHRNSAVYVKAKLAIDSLCLENLHAAKECLQFEFDFSPKDRILVLSQLLRLDQLRPDSCSLCYSRFVHIMDVLALEADYHKRNGSFYPFAHENVCSQKAEQMASFEYLRRNDGITLRSWLRRARLSFDIDRDFLAKKADRRHTRDEHSHPMDADSEPVRVENDAIDDVSIVNHVISVMCKYLIGCKEDVGAKSDSNPFGSEKNGKSEPKDFHAFYAHLRSWIGLNLQADYDSQSPDKLRATVGVFTFLKNLPKILDNNLDLGNILLPMAIRFLTVIVTPGADRQHNTTSDSVGFDLNILIQIDQVAWLQTIQVVMYKYTIGDQALSKRFNQLIDICMRVLQSEFHICGKDVLDFNTRKKLKNNESETKKKAAEGRTVAVDIAQQTAKYKPVAEGCSVEEELFPLLQRSSLCNRQDVIATSRVDEDQPPPYEASIFNSGLTMTPSLGYSSKNPDRFFRAAGNSKEELLKNDDNLKEDKEKIKSKPVTIRCKRCFNEKKSYSVETLSLCITNLCQFVKFNLTSAVHFLPRLLSQLAMIAEPLCEEESGDTLHLSNTTVEVALVSKQAIRCILHQLADSHVFSCLFVLPFPKGSSFLRVLIACLRDYHLFNCVGVLKHVLEDLPFELKLPHAELECLLANMAVYLHHLRNEPALDINWQPMTNLFTTFFLDLNNYIVDEAMVSLDLVLQVMLSLFKAPILVCAKSFLLEPFSKILSTSLCKCNITVKLLYELCEVCHCSFAKDKDKLHMTRCVVSKLIGALKMNTVLPNQSVLHLLQIVLVDGGSRVNFFSTSLGDHVTDNYHLTRRCYAMECMKSHLADCWEFLGDGTFHSNLNNVERSKQSAKSEGSNPTESTYEYGLKLAVSQVAACQFHLHFNSNQYQYLYQPPSAAQHGQREFIECVSQIKKLCWIILGTLSHLGLQQGSGDNLWYPIPFEKGPTSFVNIVKVVLTAYSEQNKESQVNMTSFCYAFLFCQLWTVYCEQLSFYTLSIPRGSNPMHFSHYNPVGDYRGARKQLFEFWSRITPSVMHLLENNGQVSENIHRHITSIIECLRFYDSSILYKLYPMWSGMLKSGAGRDSCKGGDSSDLHEPPDSSEDHCQLDDEAGRLGLVGNGSPLLVQRAAKRNAQCVLNIVEMINNKLIGMEKGDGLLCIV